MAKTLAWVHGLPLVPVNHLEGHIYAAWLLDPDEAERAGARVPARGARRQRRPHVPRRDDATTCATGCSARRSTTPPARRSTRSGRLLGLPYPGGPAIMTRGGRRDAPRPPLPARLAGRHVRLLVQRPQDRRAARGRRGELGVDAGRRDEPDGRDLPDDDVAELAWAFQDSVVDVLATKTLRAAERDRRADDRRRRRRGRQRACCASGSRTARRRWASRSSCRGPGCAPTTRR